MANTDSYKNHSLNNPYFINDSNEFDDVQDYRHNYFNYGIPKIYNNRDVNFSKNYNLIPQIINSDCEIDQNHYNYVQNLTSHQAPNQYQNQIFYKPNNQNNDENYQFHINSDQYNFPFNHPSSHISPIYLNNNFNLYDGNPVQVPVEELQWIDSNKFNVNEIKLQEKTDVFISENQGIDPNDPEVHFSSVNELSNNPKLYQDGEKDCRKLFYTHLRKNILNNRSSPNNENSQNLNQNDLSEFHSQCSLTQHKEDPIIPDKSSTVFIEKKNGYNIQSDFNFPHGSSFIQSNSHDPSNCKTHSLCNQVHAQNPYAVNYTPICNTKFAVFTFERLEGIPKSVVSENPNFYIMTYMNGAEKTEKTYFTETFPSSNQSSFNSISCDFRKSVIKIPWNHEDFFCFKIMKEDEFHTDALGRVELKADALEQKVPLRVPIIGEDNLFKGFLIFYFYKLDSSFRKASMSITTMASDDKEVNYPVKNGKKRNPNGKTRETKNIPIMTILSKWCCDVPSSDLN